MSLREEATVRHARGRPRYLRPQRRLQITAFHVPRLASTRIFNPVALIPDADRRPGFGQGQSCRPTVLACEG